MKRHIYSVKSCSVVGPYTLRLEFDDSTSQTIDFLPVLKGRMFGPLRNMSLFNQVRVDPECETIVWPNGADFDPATLHDWPECAGEFIAMASRWEETEQAPSHSGEGALRVAEAGPSYATGSAHEFRKRLKLDKPLIQLWCGERLGLVVLRPSGVYYSNQSGGYACLHPLAEGVFVPIRDDALDIEKELEDYFTGPKWNGWCCEGIDEETATFIDGVLTKCPLTMEIKVDRTRLTDSHEAWVYVDYGNPQEANWSSEISGFGPCKAVLTWENSD